MKYLLALLAGASLAALPVAFAGAADPLPTPMPCVGEAGTDKTNDLIDLSPLPAFEANADIKSYFFRYTTGSDGKPVLTANIVVADLVKAAYQQLGSLEWQVAYEVDGFARVAGAQVTPDGAVKFYDGTFFLLDPDAVPPILGLPTASTGRFLEGKDGVVEIVLNGVADLKGKTLKNVYARTKMGPMPIPQQGPGYEVDRAPDDDTKFGKDFVVQECPPEPVTTTETTTTTTTTTEQPPPQPQPQPQPQPTPTPAPAGPQGPLPAGSPLPATGTLTVDVAADKGKRKTAVKRGLRARVRCSVQCKVKATATITKKTARKLKLGRKAMRIGTGKASIKKAGRIPFYVKLTKKTKRALKRKGVKKFALKVAFKVSDNQGKQLKKVTKKSTLR
jgi:hypothetical protein